MFRYFLHYVLYYNEFKFVFSSNNIIIHGHHTAIIYIYFINR